MPSRRNDGGLKKIAIATLGCKTNQFESAAMIEQFKNAGYSIVPFTEPADLYVVNSCTVTARTDAETRRLIRRAKRLNKNARIVATGCYAQVSPDELSKMPEVDAVLGNSEKFDLAAIEKSESSRVGNIAAEIEIQPLRLTSFAEHTRAFLQIQNGCDSFCAYCIVPFARGRSRSAPPEEALSAIGSLRNNGFKEVALTGIHLGGYGRDLTPKYSLEDLVRRILEETNLPRLRIGSVDPNEFGENLISLCASSPRLCRHFHIPLQSGCDSVLRRMERPYASADYHNLLNAIINAMPDVFIGSDVIAGFPGESEEEFETTCAFIEEMPFSNLHIFPYSKRPGTKAASMSGQIAPNIISRRAAKLREIAARKLGNFLGNMIGRNIMVLGERYDESSRMVRGLSREYAQAEFPGSPEDINTERIVTVTDIRNGAALCRREEN